MSLTATEDFTYNRSVGRPKIKTAPINLRLPAEVLQLCAAISEKTQLTRTAIIEAAVIEYASARGFSVPVQTNSGASMTNETPGDYSATDPPATKEG